MQFSVMRTRVQTLLGESSGEFYTTTEINGEINDACIEIARDTEELLTYYDMTTTDGTQTYTLPDDFLKIKRVDLHVSDSDRRDLRFMTQQEFHKYTEGASDTSGTPEIYKLEQGSVSKETADWHPGDIYLYPIPDDNGGSNYTVRAYYYQLPTTLSADTDVTELPIQCHKAVCYLAASNMALKGEDLRKHDYLLLRYENELMKIKNSYHRLQRQRNWHMRDEMGYNETEF